MGSSFTPQESTVCSVTQVCGSTAGSSLNHINGQHGLDCREFIAGKVSEQLLGATPVGTNLKSDPRFLLGAQGWHTDGEGQRLVLT